MSLIHNERTKLFSNALDRASTACFAIGALAPIVTTGPLVGVLITAFGWITVAVALHLAARRVLKGLLG